MEGIRDEEGALLAGSQRLLQARDQEDVDGTRHGVRTSRVPDQTILVGVYTELLDGSQAR
jgi:hypothetical protein